MSPPNQESAQHVTFSKLLSTTLTTVTDIGERIDEYREMGPSCGQDYDYEEATILAKVSVWPVLGLFLFLIFINDLTCSIKSPVRLYADDCVLYENIETESDCVALQADIDRI